jgi:hypothetical protein
LTDIIEHQLRIIGQHRLLSGSPAIEGDVLHISACAAHEEQKSKMGKFPTPAEA